MRQFCNKMQWIYVYLYILMKLEDSVKRPKYKGLKTYEDFLMV